MDVMTYWETCFPNCLFIYMSIFVNNMAKKRLKSSKRSSRKKNGSKANISRAKPLERASHEGNERKVHEEIINRRVSGGIRLTREEIAEAYVRAQKQWLQLPGSIIRTPTDVVLIQKSLNSKDSLAAGKTTDDS
jgi:hypothetical protein